MRKTTMKTGLICGAIVLALGTVPVSSSWSAVLKAPPKPEAESAAAETSSSPAPSSLIPGKSSDKLSYTPMKGKPYALDYVGQMQTYTARYEDTMVQIARAYNVGFVELRAANPYLDPWIPGEGKKIMIPSMHLLPRAPHNGLVINLAEMRMYVFIKSGQVKTFPLGIGREGLATPNGTTSVVRKAVGPTWRPTPRMRKEHPELPAVVGPGPDNPMGTNALYLGWPEYAIHGTDKPFSIGRRASSGCMRLYPEDISELYGMVPVGTTVTVVNQPVKLAWVGDKLYMEAHPTTEQADKMEIDGGLPGYIFTEEDMGAIVAAAADSASNLNWPLIRQVVRERRGYPVEIYRKGQVAQNKVENKAEDKGVEESKAEDAAVKTEDKPVAQKATPAKAAEIAPAPAEKPVKAEKSQDDRAEEQAEEKPVKPVKAKKAVKKAEPAAAVEADDKPVRRPVITTPN